VRLGGSVLTIPVLLAVLALPACSDDGGGDAGATEQAQEGPKVDLAAATPAEFEVHGSVGQVWLTGARPGERLRLVDRRDRLVATAEADGRGSLIFRDVEPGRGYRVASDATVSERVEVTAPDDHPNASFYRRQEIGEGYGYVETRDGTLLAINVKLPGPVEDGPYPTLIEYSGYSPADPDSPQPATLITQNLGFATVGVNMRGTGCSGGAFQFFEPLQSTDGYDVVEAIAAQPWVEHGEVGMVGISYPGISQLFVAATQPPHLAAIAPLSVIADTARGTLAPGGILNNGFATSWAEERKRDAEAAPESGQGWAKKRIEGGDQTCLQNQALRDQAPDILEMIEENRYWTDEVAAPLAPELFVDRIEVPVFLAGAWQDEQTGGYFANMLDDFTGTDEAWFTVTNGGHTDALGPLVFDRWIQFLQIYVARDVPKRPAAAAIVASTIGSSVFGVPVELPPDRFAGATSLREAQQTFERDPRLRVLFENGAGGAPGAPVPTFEAGFDGWPVPGTEARPWYFGPGGTLTDEADGDETKSSYRYDPSRSQTTTLDGDSSSAPWAALPPWNWTAPPEGTAVAYESAPLGEDLVMVGTGSVDLWIQADQDDVDLQVTLSEVRPDGKEVFVQAGWLRASHRALHDDSTELRPLHRHTEKDAAPLPEGEWSEARVEIFPFGHVFRAGSRIKVQVDAPGGTRPRWKFDALPAEGDAEVRIAQGGEHASRVVLPVVDPGVPVPRAFPPCPSLRAQPCR
jgi:predicted acyl esterase